MRQAAERHAQSHKPAERVPQLVRQFSGFFLVTTSGEVWRVFDCDVDGENRRTPSAGLGVSARIFIAPDGSADQFIYRFAGVESRSLDVAQLTAQLTRSLPTA